MCSSVDENIVVRGSRKPRPARPSGAAVRRPLLQCSGLQNAAAVSNMDWLHLRLKAKTCILARNTYTFPKTQTWYAKEHCGSFGMNLRDHLGQ